MLKGRGSKKKGTFKESYVVPSWNHLYIIRNNRPILDKYATSHKNTLVKLCTEWLQDSSWKPTVNTKVIVRIMVFWPDLRKRDAHNLDKLVLDAMEEAGLFDNDACALVRYMDISVDRENPRLEITLEKGGSMPS